MTRQIPDRLEADGEGYFLTSCPPILPAGHPLWTTPNTVLTPHVGGNTDLSVPRSIELMRRQVAALGEGRPFENVIRS